MAVVLGALLFSSAPALALNETYTWDGVSNVTTFTAAAGGQGEYTKDATFTYQSVDAAGDATYSGTASYACTDKSQHTDKLTVTIAAKYYQNGSPTNGTEGVISGAAACAELSSPVITYANIDPVTGAPTAGNPALQCDQGSLTFLFCPVMDNISKAISTVAVQVLQPLLQVNVITPTSTPQLYQVWQHVRDFADLLFILVFFAIIASTLLQQDIAGLNPYSIKTIWVRLIIAAILVQFSFLISGFIVDIGNVLGLGINSFLSFLAPQGNAPSLSNYIGNLITGSIGAIALIGTFIVITWEIALPLLLTMGITIFVAFLTLGARFLLISLLIIAGPLACVAWVLPNTRHYLMDWLTFLFRLVLMFPLIVGIFSLAGIVNQILPFTSDTTSGVAKVAVILIKPAIAIATLALIPYSFKLAGKGLERAYGLINGAGNKGKGFLKDSEMYKNGTARRKERKADIMQKLSSDSSITSLTNSSNPLKSLAGRGLVGLGGLAIAGPRTSAGIQRATKTAQTDRAKMLEEFENIPISVLSDAFMGALGDKEKLRKVRQTNRVAYEFTKTLSGRTALAAKLNASNSISPEHMRQWLGTPGNPGLRSSERELIMNTQRVSKNNYPKRPDMFQIDSKTGLASAGYGAALSNITPATINRGDLDRKSIQSATGKSVKRDDGVTTYTPDDLSKSFAQHWRNTLTPSFINSVFDNSPDNRDRGSAAARGDLARLIGTNKSLWQSTPEGVASLNAFRAQMAQSYNQDIYKDYVMTVVGKDKVDVEPLALDDATMKNDIDNSLL